MIQVVTEVILSCAISSYTPHAPYLEYIIYFILHSLGVIGKIVAKVLSMKTHTKIAEMTVTCSWTGVAVATTSMTFSPM